MLYNKCNDIVKGLNHKLKSEERNEILNTIDKHYIGGKEHYINASDQTLAKMYRDSILDWIIA